MKAKREEASPEEALHHDDSVKPPTSQGAVAQLLYELIGDDYARV